MNAAGVGNMPLKAADTANLQSQKSKTSTSTSSELFDAALFASLMLLPGSNGQPSVPVKTSPEQVSTVGSNNKPVAVPTEQLTLVKQPIFGAKGPSSGIPKPASGASMSTLNQSNHAVQPKVMSQRSNVSVLSSGPSNAVSEGKGDVRRYTPSNLMQLDALSKNGVGMMPPLSGPPSALSKPLKVAKDTVSESESLQHTTIALVEDTATKRGAEGQQVPAVQPEQTLSQVGISIKAGTASPLKLSSAVENLANHFVGTNVVPPKVNVQSIVPQAGFPKKVSGASVPSTKDTLSSNESPNTKGFAQQTSNLVVNGQSPFHLTYATVSTVQTSVPWSPQQVNAWAQFGQMVTGQLQDGSQVLQVQVHPRELGDLTITVQKINGQLHVGISATESQTAQWLQQQVSNITQAVQAQGLDLQSVNVSVSTGNQGGTSNGSYQEHRDSLDALSSVNRASGGVASNATTRGVENGTWLRNDTAQSSSRVSIQV